MRFVEGEARYTFRLYKKTITTWGRRRGPEGQAMPSRFRVLYALARPVNRGNQHDEIQVAFAASTYAAMYPMRENVRGSASSLGERRISHLSSSRDTISTYIPMGLSDLSPLRCVDCASVASVSLCTRLDAWSLLDGYFILRGVSRLMGVRHTHGIP